MESARPRVSFSDLCQQPDDGRRYELYDGEVFVVPSPLPLHQIVALNIQDWLRHHPRTRHGFLAVAPLDIVLSEFNVVQPDVLYFDANRLGDLSARAVIRLPPDLAIEVLSPGTELNDRGRKMQLLARFGVREYWLVDPIATQIEVYSLEGEQYVRAQLAEGDNPLESPLLGHLGGRVMELFRSPI